MVCVCAALIETLRLALVAAEVASVPDITFFGDDDVPEEVLLQLFEIEADLLFSWLMLGGCGEEGAAAEAEERYGNLVAVMEEDIWAAFQRLDEAAREAVDENALARMSLTGTETPVRLHSLASPSLVNWAYISISTSISISISIYIYI